jgi:hypothetical protein
MSKKELLTLVAAVLTTLAETNSGAPESQLYILCGMDMERYSILRNALLQCKFVKISGNFVTLTTEGKIAADRLLAVIAK